MLREFAVDGSSVPIQSISRHLARNSTDLKAISPKTLELVVGSAFKEVMDCEAIHVGGPNDHGIDLILLDGERRYVVQVKRRESPDSAEAVSGIREFVGAMVIAQAVRGIFVTTAPKFSQQAKEAANKAEQTSLIERIELFDSSRLVDLLKLAVAKEPEPWTKAKSSLEGFPSSIQPGFSRFLDLALGPAEASS